MKFQLYRIETSFPMWSILCTENKLLSIIMIKLDKRSVNKHMFYSEISSKQNGDIYGIPIYM